MKILFIEPCPINFGGYFRSYELCAALSSQGHQIDLLVSSSPQASLKIERHSINPYLNLYVLPRFHSHFLFNGRILRGLIALAFGIIKNYDIIHLTSPVQLESNIPGTVLKIMGKKIVFSWDDLWSSDNNFPFLIHLYLNFWEKISPRFFGNVVAISHLIQEQAKSLGAKRTVLIPNGTDPNYPRPTKAQSRHLLKLDPHRFYLFTFGNTFNQERIKLLYKTFRKIHQIEPKTFLITNFSHRSQKNILHVGYIPDQLLPYYLAASDAVLLLLGDNLNERACFPVRMSKIISSLSTTIIRDNNSETTNLLKKYKCAIIDKDLDVLSEKAVHYLKQPYQQRQLKTNLEIAVKSLSWQRLAVKLIRFYETIQN